MKWIEERTYIECPNCHDIWHYEKNQTERFKFCPTCGYKQVKDKQPKKPNCHFCDHLKDEYCEVLDINPCCPEKGCDYFEPRMGRIHEICEEIKKLSERMEDIEKEIKKEKEEEIERLKAEIEMYHLQRKLNESYIRRKVRKEESE